MTDVDVRPLLPFDLVTADDARDVRRMDVEELAALHAAGFPPGARWSVPAIIGSLVERGAFDVQEPGGFAIGRVAADEAELLTLVVAPFLRRTGIATRLLAAFDAEARARGAVVAFLEVAETNSAACALYARLGWRPAGRRRGYYGDIDALILCKTL